MGHKLKFSNKDLIIRAFRNADIDEKDFLTMQEFVMAYNELYYGSLESLVDQVEETTFVRAVRYGVDKSVKPTKTIMQVYSGNLKKITHFLNLLDTKKNERDESKDDVQDACEISYECDLENILQMMLDDSKDNFLYDSKILWWVDIAVQEILPGFLCLSIIFVYPYFIFYGGKNC